METQADSVELSFDDTEMSWSLSIRRSRGDLVRIWHTDLGLLRVPAYGDGSPISTVYGPESAPAMAAERAKATIDRSGTGSAETLAATADLLRLVIP